MRTENEHIMRTLRAQAWERAKGELQAVLTTFWGGHGSDENAQFKELDAEVKAFVQKVENNGMAE